MDETVATRSIIVGTRGSKLALVQTQLVLERLVEAHPGVEFRIKTIRTQGDRQRNRSLSRMGGQGVFVKELEEALLSADIDMAVHSLKDMPTQTSDRFRLAAVAMRVDARDALISRAGRSLAALRRGARVATGSARRAAQLRAYRRDIEICPLRGNIDTRLGKLDSAGLDGIIVAAAAMIRLRWEHRITEYLPTDSFLPSGGQGALALEVNAQDHESAAIASVIDDEATHQAVDAERAFLSTLEAGCRAPVAVLGTVADGVLRLEGMVAAVDGTTILRDTQKGSPAQPGEVGRLLAETLLARGASDLIPEKCR